MGIHNKIKAAETIYPRGGNKLDALVLDILSNEDFDKGKSYYYEGRKLYKETSFCAKYFPILAKHRPDFNQKAEELEKVVDVKIHYKTTPYLKRIVDFRRAVCVGLGVLMGTMISPLALGIGAGIAVYAACEALVGMDATWETQGWLDTRASKVDATLTKYLS